MASKGKAEDDELGVRLDWPSEDGEFERPGGSAAPVVDEEPGSTKPSVRRQASSGDQPGEAPASLPPGPLLPALLGKLEGVSATIATLAMRVDALGATTTGVHSAFSDRLNEYVDTVARITRAQQEALEEYRHGTDRSVTELRRSVAGSEDLLRRVAARLDEMVTDVASFGDAARTLPRRPGGAGSGASRRGGAPMASDEISAELAGLRDDIVQLKRRIGVRAKAPAVLGDEQIDELLDRLAERIGPPRFADEDVDRVARAVVAQLEQYLEVVPDEPSGPVASPQRPAPSRRRSR